MFDRFLAAWPSKPRPVANLLEIENAELRSILREVQQYFNRSFWAPFEPDAWTLRDKIAKVLGSRG
jgi:hypothetical protein